MEIGKSQKRIDFGMGVTHPVAPRSTTSYCRLVAIIGTHEVL
jgi:hypothetical protein